jgi:NifU-like protein involved in Fe-S cluster formation
MSSDGDLVNLYSSRILALAADVPHVGRLEHAHATARRRSPQCGSTVSVDVRIKGGRIVDFAQDVRACALGQAAASVLGRAAIGRTRAEVETARDMLHAMLKEGGPTPLPPFSDLEVLVAARDFENRHPSIMLAFEAAAAAMAEAEAVA